MCIAGALSIITSISLFIASGRNKRKAMNVSGYLEIRPNPRYNSKMNNSNTS
jgi:hypothetical protein